MKMPPKILSTEKSIYLENKEMHHEAFRVKSNIKMDELVNQFGFSPFREKEVLIKINNIRNEVKKCLR